MSAFGDKQTFQVPAGVLCPECPQLGDGLLASISSPKAACPLENLWHHWGGRSEKVDAKGRSLTQYLPIHGAAFHCLWWLLKWKKKKEGEEKGWGRVGKKEGVRRKGWEGRSQYFFDLIRFDPHVWVLLVIRRNFVHQDRKTCDTVLLIPN